MDVHWTPWRLTSRTTHGCLGMELVDLMTRVRTELLLEVMRGALLCDCTAIVGHWLVALRLVSRLSLDSHSVWAIARHLG